MKIALFRRLLDGFQLDTVLQEEQVSPDNLYGREYARVTEWTEVELKPLPPQEYIGKQLQQLDAAETELRNRFAQKLSELADERAKLLSLTHESAS